MQKVHSKSDSNREEPRKDREEIQRAMSQDGPNKCMDTQCLIEKRYRELYQTDSDTEQPPKERDTENYIPMIYVWRCT